MWEESQAENTKLRLELSGVRNDLETARNHLSSAEKKVTQHCGVKQSYQAKLNFPGGQEQCCHRSGKEGKENCCQEIGRDGGGVKGKG